MLHTLHLHPSVAEFSCRAACRVTDSTLLTTYCSGPSKAKEGSRSQPDSCLEVSEEVSTIHFSCDAAINTLLLDKSMARSEHDLVALAADSFFTACAGCCSGSKKRAKPSCVKEEEPAEGEPGPSDATPPSKKPRRQPPHDKSRRPARHESSRSVSPAAEELQSQPRAGKAAAAEGRKRTAAPGSEPKSSKGKTTKIAMSSKSPDLPSAVAQGRQTGARHAAVHLGSREAEIMQCAEGLKGAHDLLMRALEPSHKDQTFNSAFQQVPTQCYFIY